MSNLSGLAEPLRIKSFLGEYQVNFPKDVDTTLSSYARESSHFIIDSNVALKQAKRLAPVLESGKALLLDATEENKDLRKIADHIQRLLCQNPRRDHVLVAIGGGIIQDITCFISSVLFRGIAWEFFPTTLLAQADSCIGSKSSINLAEVKNLLGTFRAPRNIFLSPDFLETLSEQELRSGVGEMLKVHIIDGIDSFREIARAYPELFQDKKTLLHFIRRSLEIKRRLVECDEFDKDTRNILNYGHSFGHALESATDFAIPHGIAITIGMDMANSLAVEKGLCSTEFLGETKPLLLRNAGTFAQYPIPIEKFLFALSKDKKNVGGALTLILPGLKGIPEKVRTLPDEAFLSFCTKYFDSCQKA